ncbi:pirin family protein [uncultured Reyranella sp.]|uniref:pirin family protein n=1 Tax=uncultured Reyranella sp. TaxID=735512 RepID=UPI0025CD6969|nr:pirin family protein [uncultured Reyranella sp.]
MNSNKRQLISIHDAFRTLEGDGFEVRRAIPSNAYEAIGPFIFLDQFGPIDVRPGEAKGASAHPHAGIETLTLLLEGSQTHKDSLGNVSSMRPGEVQWMRAGRGVVHDESPDEQLRREGGHVHGVQLWINMPKGSKHAEPAYRHVKASEIPTVTADEGRVVARLVAGSLGDLRGPITTSGAPFVVHASLKAGACVELPAGSPAELGIYVMGGAARIGGDDRRIEACQLARLTAGDSLEIVAAEDSEVLLVGGDPLDAPILRHGPFVMNSIDELERAVRDYHAGRMGQVPA